MADMKKHLKTGLLIIMLAVPVFLFLFLKFFGENKFDLPYLVALGVEKTSFSELYNDYDQNLDENYLKSIPGDSIYLVFPEIDSNLDGSKAVLILYSPLQSFNENQQLEIDRFKSKIKNPTDLNIIEIKNAETDKFWSLFFKVNKQKGRTFVNNVGMIALLDQKGFFRGIYNPSIKSEIDRLITEYQILEDGGF